MHSKKKVIFIGSTSYSGSTLIDKIIANDNRGYSLGEVYALIHPYRSEHVAVRNDLIAQDSRWEKIVSNRGDHFYSRLFRAYPDIDFFVDSSKDPFWIQRQADILKKLNCQTYHISIYKEPIEIAASFAKRNIDNWEKGWIDYYKLYFSLVGNFVSIAYKDLVTKPEALQKLCDHIGIPYFEDKNKYWTRKQFTLFGNSGTRVQRKIYYTEINNDHLKKDVEYKLRANKMILIIKNELEASNLFCNNCISQQVVKYDSTSIIFKKIKKNIKDKLLSIYYKVFY